MTRRKVKKYVTKKKQYNKKLKKTNKNKQKYTKRIKYTKGVKYGGESDLEKEQKLKTVYRRTLANLTSQIINKSNSKNKIKEGINYLTNLFKDNKMINTLIPVSSTGAYIDKEHGSGTIVDFVSPVTFILDNLTGQVPQQVIVRILNSYFLNGGNINSLSSRYKISAFKNELNKGRVENIRMLLDKSNQFHILEEGLDQDSSSKLAELIPNEQQIITEPRPEEVPRPEEAVRPEEVSLQLPYPLPENNDVGYDRETVPEFWKPIFQNGNELLELKETFMEIYELDKYKDENQKRFKICDILEKIIPGYVTRYTLQYREIVKTLVNVNILNCFITLLYGIILYRLFEYKQEYIFIFKGGRALQLCLVDIPNIGTYFSEDTDLLIVPNKSVNSVYNSEKMENLSSHIGYLVKWFIPEEINIIVSLPTNPKNLNKDITKLVYNDGKIYKALSDIGFGEIHEDIVKYFDKFNYFPFYIDEFETISLFITPTIEDMLSEKLFYYSKYFKIKQESDSEKKQILLKNPGGQIEVLDPVLFDKILEQDRLLLKFMRAIVKLVEGITKMKYADTEDFNKTETARYILQDIIGNFHDYNTDERNNIIASILQNIR